MTKQEFKCYCCKNYIGNTYGGYLQKCSKEKTAVDNIIHETTIQMCRKKEWYEDLLK